MAQICKACVHADSRALDAALLAGVESVGELAEKYRLTDSSIRRHRANHLAAALLTAPESADGTTPTDLIEKLVAVLQGAETVHRAALVANKPLLALQAGREIRSTSLDLLEKLGVDDARIAAELRSGDLFTKTIGRLIRRHPRLGVLFADQLRDDGHLAEANSVQQFAEAQREKLEQRNSS